MIKYMLDTNICIYIIKQKPPQVIERLKQETISNVGISSITLSELEYGVMKSAKPNQNKLALANFIAPLEILPFDHLAAQFYGEIRSALERKGMPIGPMDMLIAAHALSLSGCTLVTNNLSEFKRVNGLVLENWVDETTYLMQSPNNADRLNKAVKQLEKGRGESG